MIYTNIRQGREESLQNNNNSSNNSNSNNKTINIQWKC